MNSFKGNLSPLVAEIVSAYVTHNKVDAGELPKLINRVHESFLVLENATSRTEGTKAILPKPRPAYAIAHSVQGDYLVCLEDGKRMKMLKRYLQRVYNLTPEQYRQRWELPPDYPMVAPNYAQKRSDLAKSAGLGIKGRKQKNGRL